MASYLITGGAGFIGSHLANSLLADGHRVRIIDDFSTGKRERVPAGSELIVGDVCDREVVTRAMQEMDGCFHLAAVSSVQRSVEHWIDTHHDNLGGTVTILDAARARRTPVV